MDPSWVAPLARGLGVTLMVFIIAALVAGVSGAGVGALAARGHRSLRLACRCYVEFMRGTSALVQLFWVVFALPMAGVRVDPLLGGALVLGLNAGAYAAEAVRGALLAVPQGQRDAATVIGLSGWQRLLRIELPQAVPVVLPTATNLAIELLKNTSLVSLVGLADLTFQANALRSSTLVDLPILVVLLAIYLGLAQILAVAGRLGEARCARWHRGMAA